VINVDVECCKISKCCRVLLNGVLGHDDTMNLELAIISTI